MEKNTVDLGFGCYFPGTDPGAVTEILLQALDAGYRYFDTASYYFTEAQLGEALRQVKIAREDVFIATKLWMSERGYSAANAALERSLERLGLDYVDAYLIHWPKGPDPEEDWLSFDLETLRAMEEQKQKGRVREIGLSNFLPHHFQPLLAAGFRPSINQLELHPGYGQEFAVRESLAAGMQVQAWSPLGRGAVLSDPLITKLADAYDASASQICLAYLKKRGIFPIVKASSAKRMKENLAFSEVNLTERDLSRIACLPQIGYSGEHPDRSMPGSVHVTGSRANL